jgi:LmbE family N-acetylglucosaminyl deacetylase
MSSNILVVAAHPDDEVLGCGGIIAKHVKLGDKVNVLFLTDGVSARDGTDENNANERAERKESACMALEILGVSDVVFETFPDNQLDSIPLLKVVKVIECMAKRTCPNVVYSHSSADLNVDHVIAAKAVRTAFRPTKDSTVNKLLSFEVMSSTEWAFDLNGVFKPNVYIDVSQFWDKKIAALECYMAEMRSSPHARSFRSIEAHGARNGETVGFEYAEVLELVWERN